MADFFVGELTANQYELDSYIDLQGPFERQRAQRCLVYVTRSTCVLHLYDAMRPFPKGGNIVDLNSPD